MLNELLFEAGRTYWDWFLAYNNLTVYQNAVRVAEERLNAVKREALLGNRAGIDTLEAGIQLQNRQLDLQEAQLEFENQGALLSVYLWADGTIPLEIDQGTRPLSAENFSVQEVDDDFVQVLNNRLENHPVLQQFRLQIDQMEIDRRLKAEQLKPNLNLSYKPLTAAAEDDIISNYRVRDYMWSLQFNSPIFLRKERGAHKLAKIKIREAELGIQNKQENLVYEAKASLNTWNMTEQQIELYTQTVEDYRRLLEGERSLFRGGESSLFMVNSRERNFAQQQANSPV